MQNQGWIACSSGLHLQFWGAKSLDKIVEKVWAPIKMDHMTTTKGRISYVRVPMDVDTSREFVKMVSFKGPDGIVYDQEGKYE